MNKYLTIKDANCRINEIDNQLEYYLNKKERYYSRTQPQATKITGEIAGTAREDKFFSYALACEEVDPIIDELQNEKQDLLKFIEKELIRLNKYNELEKLVIYYKEQYIPKREEYMTWYFISKKVHASESTCRRIYRKYKNRRNIEFEQL